MKPKLESHELSFKVVPSGVPGTHCHIATTTYSPMPIGIVWFRYAADDTIELLQSFVRVLNRRQGVRTAIHRDMIKQHGMPNYKSWQFMRTTTGNRQSTPWLRKMGFKHRNDRNCWELKFQ